MNTMLEYITELERKDLAIRADAVKRIITGESFKSCPEWWQHYSTQNFAQMTRLTAGTGMPFSRKSMHLDKDGN